MSKVTDLFDIKELITRLIKYFILGLTISVAAYLVGHKKLDYQEIGILGLTAGTVIAILDTFSPSVAATVRAGAGLGIGWELASFFI